MNEMKLVLIASHPWSNNCPRGEDCPVRLAYFPSTASNVWYINIANALKKYVYAENSMVLLASNGTYCKVAITVNKRANNVNRFGATHYKILKFVF
jgi:hypothetical protein